ncbi:MAG: alpha-xylosidase [Puniceicoccaceae bacterium]|nr:MAG: alpha-xylosidase [Puniceicoccaceae bacterium]
MKFTDGNWMHQPDVTAHYPAEVHDITREGDALVVHAPTRPIRHRGDTLQGPLLTIRLFSPCEGVIGVRIEHYTGGPETQPRIPLQNLDTTPVEIADSADAATLTSGELTVRFSRKNWEVAFLHVGRMLTRSGFRGMGLIEHREAGRFIHEQLSLGVGEAVYGLGERFTALVKNGQVVETWNKDGGTGCDQAYKAVPFYLTNRGYGVLVNDTGPVSFEVASEKVSRVQFSLPGERLEYFVFLGPEPKDVLRRLTRLTGRPALPPAWSFGLWLTTSFTTNYNEETVMSFIDGMKQRQLPLHVFHFDCFWMREFNWCDFEWDPRVFPDPAGLLRRLHDRGLRVCLWINPYIGQRSPLFEEGKAGGFLLRRTDGSVWQTNQWQPGMGIVDFTNPRAREWYQGHLRRLLRMGVDCYKTDFGERIPTDVAWHDGSDPYRMHNYYSVLYNETVFELLEEERGRGEAVVFARSATTSGQRFPVHWGGDCDSTYESMAESLRGGLSLSLCGFGYWSHDIGGFEGLPRADIYKRWIAFGLLSSHSRLHGSSSYRVPWNYDDEACDVLRFFTRLKCRLMPYLYGSAVQAHREGLPMMRAMVLEFPGDPACDTLDRQYLLGDALLVAPVLSSGGECDFYLPEGRWTHLLTGETVDGGRWRRDRHDFLSLPLFVRPGTLLPMGTCEDRPDYAFSQDVRFRLYELAEGQSTERIVPTLTGEDGLRLRVHRRGRVLEVEANPSDRADWRLELVGIPSVARVEGGSAQEGDGGVVLAPAEGSSGMKIELHP